MESSMDDDMEALDSLNDGETDKSSAVSKQVISLNMIL